MKKGKVFGKHHVVLALMVLALGAAVWLNMKFSSTEKYLGQATLVNNSDISSGEAVQTAAKVESNEDYFEKAKKDRQKALDEAQEIVEEKPALALITSTASPAPFSLHPAGSTLFSALSFASSSLSP